MPVIMPKKVSPSDKIKREEEKKKNTFFKEVRSSTT